MSLSSSTVGGKIKYKIVFLGDQHVGKTSIIQRFINDRFESTYNATIGIDFLVKNLVHNNRTYRLQLWDTAGQQRFKSLIPSYLKDSHLCILVYDVMNVESLRNLPKWLELYEQHKEYSAFSVVVGNKNDLLHKEGKHAEEMESAMQQMKELKQYKISAKTGEGVPELMREIIDLITQNLNNIKIIDQIDQKQQRQQGNSHPYQASGSAKPTIQLDQPVKLPQPSDPKQRQCC